MPSLKEIVRTARVEQCQMTLKEFAAAVGVSDNTVASIEYGGRPTRPIIEKLAEFLKRPVSELDPTGITLRPVRPRAEASGQRPGGPAAELREQLRVLHAEFNMAHGTAVEAVRANDIPALTAARQRQAEILAQQGALIDAYVSASPHEAGQGRGRRARALTPATTHVALEDESRRGLDA